MAATIQELKDAAANMANAATGAAKDVFNEYSKSLGSLAAGTKPPTFQEFVARIRTQAKYATDAGKRAISEAENFYNTNAAATFFKNKISEFLGAGVEAGGKLESSDGGNKFMSGGIMALIGAIAGLATGGLWGAIIGALIGAAGGAVFSKYIGQAIDWVGRQIGGETGKNISGFGQGLANGQSGPGTAQSQPVVTPTGDKVKVKEGAKIISGPGAFVDAPADPAKAPDITVRLANEDVFTGHVEGDKFIVTSYARKMADGRMGTPVALNPSVRPKLAIGADGTININDTALVPAQTVATASNAEAIEKQKLAVRDTGTLGINKIQLREFDGTDGRRYRMALFGKEDGGKITFSVATLERTNAAGAWETVKKPDGTAREFGTNVVLAVTAAGGAKTVTMDNWTMDHLTDSGAKAIIGEEKAAAAALEAKRAAAKAAIISTINAAPNAADATGKLRQLLTAFTTSAGAKDLPSTAAGLAVADWYTKDANRRKEANDATFNEIANLDAVKKLPDTARKALMDDIIKPYHDDIRKALTAKKGGPGDIVAMGGSTVPMVPTPRETGGHTASV